MLFNVARRVNPAPAVMVPNRPESSITAPKISSPAVLVVAAVDVIPLPAVVPLA
jgi:hypothetical protein